MTGPPLCDVVYLSACDWGAPWHGPQELATRLAGAGHRVVYVETLGRRRPQLQDVPRILRRVGSHLGGAGSAAAVAPGIEIVSPLVIPGRGGRLARAVNRRLMGRFVPSRKASARPTVLWIYTPTRLAIDLIDAVEPDLVIYHCTQSQRHRPAAPPDVEALEDELMARSHAVVVDSIELMRERAPRHPDVRRIPSGVNADDHSSAVAASWAARLSRPIVGYLGSIDHRVDVALIEGVARSLSDGTVVLVGPVGDAPVRGLRRLSNVVFHQQVAIEEVPSVLATFDVGIMPYADRPLTQYTYPAKLHQYLAAGLPVVSTPLPDLEELDDLVEIGGHDPQGFAAAVERALRAPRREDERRAVAAANTWSSRFSAFEEILRSHLRSGRRRSPGESRERERA